MVISGEDASMVEDVNDDLTRELAFYNQVQLPAWMYTRGLLCVGLAASILTIQSA